MHAARRRRRRDGFSRTRDGRAPRSQGPGRRGTGGRPLTSLPKRWRRFGDRRRFVSDDTLGRGDAAARGDRHPGFGRARSRPGRGRRGLHHLWPIGAGPPVLLLIGLVGPQDGWALGRRGAAASWPRRAGHGQARHPAPLPAALRVRPPAAGATALRVRPPAAGATALRVRPPAAGAAALRVRPPAAGPAALRVRPPAAGAAALRVRPPAAGAAGAAASADRRAMPFAGRGRLGLRQCLRSGT